MNVNYDTTTSLVPVIVQDATTQQVLMLGYMNAEALAETNKSKNVCFYSRSKQRLWTKGETSGNFLKVQEILLDCDGDTLLIKAFPAGPTCHNGTTSCFAEETTKGFAYKLEETIAKRIAEKTTDSYTYKLVQSGINKVAQKVGEEAVELVIEAKDDNKELFENEAADLLYHYIILLQAKGSSLVEVERILEQRSRK